MCLVIHAYNCSCLHGPDDSSYFFVASQGSTGAFGRCLSKRILPSVTTCASLTCLLQPAGPKPHEGFGKAERQTSKKKRRKKKSVPRNKQQGRKREGEQEAADQDKSNEDPVSREADSLDLQCDGEGKPYASSHLQTFCVHSEQHTTPGVCGVSQATVQLAVLLELASSIYQHICFNALIDWPSLAGLLRTSYKGCLC